MLHTLAISGYRSLKDIVLELGQLNLITGPNGSGKSNIYKGLRLLASAAEGRLIQTLASEGGLQSTLWAGPERFSAEELGGEMIAQGKVRKGPVALRLGYTSDDFSYTIELGLPMPSRTAFGRDPVIKRECLWRGHTRMPRFLCADRRGPHLRVRPDRKWEETDVPFNNYTSMLTEYSDPKRAPEIMLMRESVRNWRFYDHFRTDETAPARRVEVGTFTPVLSSTGSDLAAALQTIIEIGNEEALAETIDDAFPGTSLRISNSDSRFEVMLQQDGMLRPLRSSELSDGTLRYLFLCAALLTPRPPELMVLNEPEASLHPDLIPALGRLILEFAKGNQLFVVTHSELLINTLLRYDQCAHFRLEKKCGMTRLQGVNDLDIPAWKWPAR